MGEDKYVPGGAHKADHRRRWIIGSAVMELSITVGGFSLIHRGEQALAQQKG